MTKRAGLISRVAGINLILERLSQQDRVLQEIEKQAKRTNGHVADLKEQEIRRKERERLGTEARTRRRREREDDRSAWVQYRAAAIGATTVGAVTVLLHYGFHVG